MCAGYILNVISLMSLVTQHVLLKKYDRKRETHETRCTCVRSVTKACPRAKESFAGENIKVTLFATCY